MIFLENFYHSLVHITGKYGCMVEMQRGLWPGFREGWRTLENLGDWCFSCLGRPVREEVNWAMERREVEEEGVRHLMFLLN